jgi:hypothetical protein
MTREQYYALCVIGCIAVAALVQTYTIKQAMRSGAPLYNPPKSYTA